MTRATELKPGRHIPSPAQRCRPSWRCPVCGMYPKALVCEDPTKPEKVRCGLCQFPFTLKVPEPKQRRKYVPKPRLNADWRYIWERARDHFGTGMATRCFMKQFKRMEQANNAMNRLDGGGAHAREQMRKEEAN